MKVTKKALNQQLRAVFGKGAEYEYDVPGGIRVSFNKRRGESLEDLKTRLLERLDQLPGADT